MRARSGHLHGTKSIGKLKQLAVNKVLRMVLEQQPMQQQWAEAAAGASSEAIHLALWVAATPSLRPSGDPKTGCA